MENSLTFENEVMLRGLMPMVQEVARIYQVTLEEIGGRERSQRVVAARRAIVRKLRAEKPGWSWPEIGRLFGRHRSVMQRLYGGADDAGSSAR